MPNIREKPNEMKATIAPSKEEFMKGIGFKGYKFFGLTAIKKISSTHNVKIALSSSDKKANGYDGLTVSIIHKEDGVLDEMVFQFDDYLKLKTGSQEARGFKVEVFSARQGGSLLKRVVLWKHEQPSSDSLKKMLNSVEEYIDFY